MTKIKRVFLAVSTVILSLCIAFSALFLALLCSSDKPVRAAETPQISDFVGYWRFNDSIVFGSFHNTFYMSFECDGVLYNTIDVYPDISALSFDSTYVYQNGAWVDDSFKLIDVSSVESYNDLLQLQQFLDDNAVPLFSYDVGYSDGYDEGYNTGKTDGYDEGYNTGKTDGYDEGYNTGKTDGYDEGFSAGQSASYSDGYSAGYNKGLSDSLDNPVSFFLSPLDSFMSIDLFGNFSVGDVFSVILFVSLGLIVIKMFAGG